MDADTVGFVITEAVGFMVIVETVGTIPSVPDVQHDVLIAVPAGDRIHTAYRV